MECSLGFKIQGKTLHYAFNAKNVSAAKRLASMYWRHILERYDIPQLMPTEPTLWKDRPQTYQIKWEP
jgi:hypothetical protein